MLPLGPCVGESRNQRQITTVSPKAPRILLVLRPRPTLYISIGIKEPRLGVLT